MTTSAARTDHNWWAVAYGILTVITGVLALTWPAATLFILAVVFGIQLILAGVFQIAVATGASAPGAARVPAAILGVLSLIAGVVCLFVPALTLAAVVLLLGGYWVASGILEIVHAFATGATKRGWMIAGGVISVLAGVVVLFYPGITLLTLALLLGIMLIVYGTVTVVRGMRPEMQAPPAHAAGAPA